MGTLCPRGARDLQLLLYGFYVQVCLGCMIVLIPDKVHGTKDHFLSSSVSLGWKILVLTSVSWRTRRRRWSCWCSKVSRAALGCRLLPSSLPFSHQNQDHFRPQVGRVFLLVNGGGTKTERDRRKEIGEELKEGSRQGGREGERGEPCFVPGVGRWELGGEALLKDGMMEKHFCSFFLSPRRWCV